MTSEGVDVEELLPLKPRPPQPSDCCGNGCCPCVHDIYEQDLKKWRKACEQIRNGYRDDHAKTDNAIVSYDWREFEIVNVKEVSADIFCYTFKLEDTQVLGVNVGQHIIVKQIKNNRVVTRQYTPVSDINKRGSFEVLIKIYPKGKITPLIKDWQVGDFIPWRGPYGDFTYHANSYKRILMLAGGTGIAPMYQIIKAVIGNEEDETFIKLFYASKCISDILLRVELAAFCQFWNFTACHYLSEETDFSQKRYCEEMVGRRVCKEDVSQELVRGPVDSTLVLICGTNSFNKDIVNYAKGAGIPDIHIFRF